MLRSLTLVLLLAGCLLAGLTGCTAARAPAAPDPGFRATVAAHLAAVEARDLDALLATVTATDSLTVIFPGGEALFTRAAYEALHREWFAAPGWSIAFQPLRYVDGPAVGTALVGTPLADDTPASGRQAYLALTFAVEDGAWRLVLDQNTRISPE